MPMNYSRTALLLVALTAILVVMGNVVGGTGGMVVAFVMALVMNLLSLWKSDTMVLKMFRAEEVDQATAPDLHRLVADLARRAELPMPRVYIMNAPQPNAFATGRNPENSAVAVSTGLLDMLSREEVSGVIAHELAHIKNRDTLTMAVAATIGGAISMLAQWMQFGMLFGGSRDQRDGGGVGFLGMLATVIVAPMAAGLVQMAISRSREYQADRMGALICGNPMWLASALAKISNAAHRIPNMAAERVPAAAHVCIVNPLSGRGVDNWFSTHPATENRIAALQALAEELGMPAGGSISDGGPVGDGRGGDEQQASGPWSNSGSGAGSRSGGVVRSERGPWG